MNPLTPLAARSLAACLAATALSIAPALAAENPKTTYVCQMANHHMATQGLDKEYDKPGICAADGMELIAKNSRLRVAVLVFDGVQDIDYAGPMEVFGQSGATIFTVAANTEPVRSTFGIRMQPDFDIAHAPAADIVLVPGGNVGTVTRNPLMMDWLRQRSGDARAVLSVCTGAFILGKAGLLDGLSATTIAGATELLAQSFPKAHVVNDRRFVDNGRIITTGGLSAGLDGALHVIDREVGRLRAEDIARGMEYAWQPDGQGGFGLLAGNQIPDLAKILPPGITWERTADRGDNQQWEVSGRIEITSSTQVFLTDSSARIAADAWVELKDGNALQRSFVKTKDGKSWQLTLTLASAGVPAAYQLLLAVKQVS